MDEVMEEKQISKAGAHADQFAHIYQVIERLEDAIAASNGRAAAWKKEKAELLATHKKDEESQGELGETVARYKNRLHEAKKEQEKLQQTIKSELAAKDEQLKKVMARNKQLEDQMHKVTDKLDAAITKIGKLMAD